MANERIVSIHIEKTAGTSLLQFYNELYGPENVYFYNPKSGFTRQDLDPAANRRSSRGERIKSTLLRFPALYRLSRKLLHSVERAAAGPATYAAPEQFSVIHGHFSPDDFPMEDGSYVTVFRNPLDRARSHYDDSIKWHTVLKPDESPPSFEEFALSEPMVNFQSKRTGHRSLDFFAHVGVTEELYRYCGYFDPSGSVILPRLNQTARPSVHNYSCEFIEAFRTAHGEDIELYNNAMERVHWEK